jgi:hypothetical protein
MNALESTKSLSAVMLGAGMFAFMYVLLTPRLLPDPISSLAGLPEGATGAVRWLVGLLAGVILMVSWLGLRAIRQSKVGQ